MKIGVGYPGTVTYESGRVEFNPVKSEAHKGYRVELDGSLTIQFPNGAYNYHSIEPEVRDEYIRRAELDGDENSNGKYFAEKIRQLPYTKLA